jgi:hypothetical protein
VGFRYHVSTRLHRRPYCIVYRDKYVKRCKVNLEKWRLSGSSRQLFLSTLSYSTQETSLRHEQLSSGNSERDNSIFSLPAHRHVVSRTPYLRVCRLSYPISNNDASSPTVRSKVPSWGSHFPALTPHPVGAPYQNGRRLDAARGHWRG